MQDKLNDIIKEYEELSVKLADPATLGNPDTFRKLSISQGALIQRYELARQIVKLLAEKAEAEALLATETDPAMQDFYNETISQNDEQLASLQAEFDELNKRTDPNALRSVIIEVRAGTGGEEAALFASELHRMYLRYAEQNSWKTEQMSLSHSATGGLKEVVFRIDGPAYGKLRYESGVHRVQRVPATESSGRIHTSAASVVVLPEAEDVQIDIKEEDLKIDVYRSSGPGGQSVNTTDSAVRITHIPTGIVVTCQDEKSQLKNKKKAMSVLKSRLFDIELQKQQAEERSKRQSAIAGGDRSAKIRTYNFPQSRVTDHRIKQSWHNIYEIMDGALEPIITALTDAAADDNT